MKATGIKRSNRKIVLKGLDWKKYEAQGVDISLIRANLSRTPTERLRVNKKLLTLIEHLRKQSDVRLPL